MGRDLVMRRGVEVEGWKMGYVLPLELELVSLRGTRQMGRHTLCLGTSARTLLVLLKGLKRRLWRGGMLMCWGRGCCARWSGIGGRGRVE